MCNKELNDEFVGVFKKKYIYIYIFIWNVIDKYKSKNVEILRFENKKAILINGVTDENVHILEILDTKG